MQKRIFGMLLAIVMVVGLIPGASLTAFAEGVTPTLTVKRDGTDLADGDSVYPGDVLTASCSDAGITYSWKNGAGGVLATTADYTVPNTGFDDYDRLYIWANGADGTVAATMSFIYRTSREVTCICETKCAEGSVNSACEVCVADLNDCTGMEGDFVLTAATEVWVGGVLLTNGQYLANGANAVTDTQPTDGYAYFADGILTLSDYIYEGVGYGDEDASDVVFANDGFLEIVLEGENSLTNTTEYSIDNGKQGCGIASLGVTIRGDGKLDISSEYGSMNAGMVTISGGTVTLNTRVAGIMAGFVKVEDGTVTINASNEVYGQCRGIDASMGVEISGGDVNINVTGEDSIGIRTGYDSGDEFVDISGGKVTINVTGEISAGISVANANISGGTVNVTAAYGGIVAETTTISGGTVEATGTEMGAFMSAPVTSDYTNAVCYYGDTKEAAETAGEKPVSDLADNYKQKYVKIAESTSSGGESNLQPAYVRTPMENQLIQKGKSSVFVPDVFSDPAMIQPIPYDVTYTHNNEELDGNVALNNWIAQQSVGTYEIAYTLTVDETQYKVQGSLTGSFTVTVVEVLFYVGEEPASADNAFIVHEENLIPGKSIEDMVTPAEGLSASCEGYTVSGDFIVITVDVDPENVPAGEVTVRLLYEGTIGEYGFSCNVCERTITVAAPEVKWGASADASLTEGTLADAIAADAAYIQLLKNITYNEQLTINNSVTLDLNGQTLTATGDNGVYVTGDLTITDSSTAGNGSLIGTATATGTSGSYGVYVNYGNITVKGGSLIGENNGNFYENYGVYVNNGSIIVESGSLTGTSTDTEGYGPGVFVSGDITVSGGRLTGTSVSDYGVCCFGSITVSGGSLTGTSTSGWSSGVSAGGDITVWGGSLTGMAGVSAGGDITVSGGSLTGTSTAEYGNGVSADGIIIIEDEGKITATGETPVYIIDEDNSSYTKQSEGTDETTGLPTVVLVAPAVTEYPLWVGGEQFTSEKLTINGTTGTAVYDPDNDTLTLNNYSYTGEGYEDAAIYYNGANTLKLNLVGDNSVTHSSDTSFSYGVYAESGSIEISGDKLTATGGAVTGFDSGSYGIRTMGDITILSGTVTATSGEAYGSHGSDSTGISVVGKFTVLGGTVTAIGGKSTSDMGGGSAGIWAYEGITISGGEIIAKGETVAFGKAPTIADTLAPFDEDGKVIGNPDYDQLKYVHIKEKIPVASVTVGSTTTNYTDIKSAVAAAQANSGSTLTLLDDFSVNEYFTVESGTFTIDLNGKTWESSKWVMLIGGDADITITDNSTNKEGKLFGAGSSYSTIVLYGNANLEIAGGTVEDDSLYVIDMTSGGTPSQAKFTLSGGKLITTNPFSINALGSSVAITGGTIESTVSDIYYYTGMINLSGHSDPTGITIYLDSRIESCDIRLPAGYVLLDNSGNAVTDPVAGPIYTVGKPVITTRIKAVNADDEALAGASMQIMNAEGDVIVIDGNKVEWDSAADNYETVAVDESIHTITGLKPGVTYTLHTTVAPAGYTVPADVEFTVDEYNKVTVTAGTGTVNVDGVLLVEFAETVVRFSAVDADGEPLEGAHLQILSKKDGQEIVREEWVSAVDNEETADVDESICTITGLYSGVEYILRATVAPAGYTVPTDTKFTLSADGVITFTGTTAKDGVLLVKFAETVVKVSAVDADGNPLEGATMQILDAKGDVVEEWGSTAGAHEVVGLNTGVEYTIRTAVAPEGYAVPADVNFSIDAEGKVTTSGTMNEDGVLLVKFEKVYTVTVEFAENGSVTPDKATAAAGETVTLTIVPDSGYTLEYIRINDDDEDYMVIGKTEVTFTMPEEDVKIEAQFTEGIVVYFDNTESQWSDVFFFYGAGHAQGRALGNDLYGLIVPTNQSGWFTNYMIGMPDSAHPEGSFRTEKITPVAGETYRYVDYSVTLNAGSGGTLTADVTKAVAGQTVTLTITPDEGYSLDTLTVMQGEDSVEIAADNTFTMPAGDVAVTATFVVCDHTGNTNTDDGNCLTGIVCSVCGGMEVEARENHTGGTATCIAKAECEVCGTEYGSVDADAHQWDNGEVTTDPTCTEAGVKTYICQYNAEHTKTEEVAIDADAHQWNNGEVTTDPTCSEVGVKTYICQHNAEHTKTEEVAIDADAHAWSVEYTFAPDGSSCTATRVCGNDAQHNVTVDAVITSEETKAPTTDAMGETTYTAEFDVDWAETQTKTIADIPTLNEVKVPETEDGDVTVDKETPAAGEKVTITVTPEPGKEVGEVIVKDENGNELPVTKNEDGTYTYEQPAGDVTIEVTFRNPAWSDTLIEWPAEIDLGTYDPNRTLGDISLADFTTEFGYFVWASPTDVPETSDKKFEVKFIPNTYAKQNYTGVPAEAKAEISVTLEPKTITASLILSQTVYPYDGGAKKPEVTAMDGSSTIPASEYKVSYSNNTGAGTAVVTVSDKNGGNYIVSGAAIFTILPREEEVTLYTVTFDGNSDNVSGVPAAQIVAEGSKLAEPAAPVKEDYELIGWSTDKAGENLWKFKADKVTENITLYAQWKQVMFDIDGDIHDKDDNILDHSIRILVKQGSRVFMETTTNEAGHYSLYHVPAGAYNIVAMETDGRTVTTKVEITDHSETVAAIRLPAENVSSELEVPAGTPNIVVGGLDDLAKNHAENKDKPVEEQPHVTVFMVVEQQEDLTDDSHVSTDEAEKKEIQDAIVNKHEESLEGSDAEEERDYTFLTIDISKTTETKNGVTTESIDETGDQLVEIIVPYETSGRKNFKVYRHHGTEIHELTEKANEAGEYIGIGDGIITIHAKKFSTYAISSIEDLEQIPEEPENPVEVENVAIEGAPSEAVQPGTSISLSADVSGTGHTGEVIWEVHGNTDKRTQITQDGVLTISENEEASSLTVTAQSKDDESKIAVITITLAPKTEPEPDDKEPENDSFDYDAWYRAVMMLRRKQALEEAAKAEKPEKPEEIPETETGWQNPFKDVAETDWFYEDVEFVNETGLMIGTNTTGTKFSPEDTLTRAMLVTILWRLESEPVVNYLMQFNDVPTEEWYTEAVRWAAAEGIVNGYGDDTFGPMNAVTREQAMAILHRYAAYKGLESGMIFPMIPQYDYSLWAENDILWADMIGLTNGIGKDIFDMTASADRAEIAAYLRRFCEAFMEE